MILSTKVLFKQLSKWLGYYDRNLICIWNQSTYCYYFHVLLGYLNENIFLTWSNQCFNHLVFFPTSPYVPVTVTLVVCVIHSQDEYWLMRATKAICHPSDACLPIIVTQGNNSTSMQYTLLTKFTKIYRKNGLLSGSLHSVSAVHDSFNLAAIPGQWLYT